MSREPPSVESDRVELFNAWMAFRARIAQQRSAGHRCGLRQSLLPMLSELLEEVSEGFRSPDHFEQPELTASVRFRRVEIHVRKGDGERCRIGGTPPPAPTSPEVFDALGVGREGSRR